MRIIIKTFTYLVIDLFVHSIIVYIAGSLLGYNVSIEQAGIVGLAIEVVETVAYYFHEVIWKKINWGK